MTVLADLFDREELDLMLSAGYVRHQTHPTLPLAILNYTEQAVYDRAWNATTRQCRGLIYKVGTTEVVARPFPKFFNYGEHEEAVGYDIATHRKVYPASDAHHALDLEAPTVVTDKLDGSLGILYPTGDGYAVATRGSFTSEQALHATEVWLDRYDRVWTPHPSLTYLFEIVYPGNRVVVDYAGQDDLFLLAALSIETGLPSLRPVWPGPRVVEFRYRTLAEALAAEPRPGAEGLVVYLPDANERVKVKQDDYVALHRILTGTNARHVYEFAAVRACRDAILRTCSESGDEGKHWASYLGLDPARVAQLLAAGEGWLTAEGIPDEFYGWVRQVIDEVEEKAGQAALDGLLLAGEAAKIKDRRERYEFVEARAGAYVREVMRLASLRPTPVAVGSRVVVNPTATEYAEMVGWEARVVRELGPDERDEEVGPMFEVRFDDGCTMQAFADELRATSGSASEAMDALLLKAWREARPEPTTPFARPEAVA